MKRQAILPLFIPKSPLSYCLLAISVIGLILRIIAALDSSRLAHPDEIFQTLEPAHRLAYGYGVITWEWRDGIRSWVLPLILAALMKCTAWIGQGSNGYIASIHCILAMASMTTVWFGYMWAKRLDGIKAGVICSAACGCSYELVEFAPRTMPEVLAAHLLLVGLYYGTCSDRFSPRYRLFMAGVSCGLAVSLRIQLAPAICFLILYFCRSSWKGRLSAGISGFFLPMLLFGLADLITWRHMFQSFYLYFWENAIEGKSLLYGSLPWYWYLVRLWRELGILTILAVFGSRRSPILGWIVLITLASHSLLDHKEFRFLYPIFPIIIVLSVLGFVDLVKVLTNQFNIHLKPEVVILAGISIFVLSSLFCSLRFPLFARQGAMMAFTKLGEQPKSCGVGLYGIPWYLTGGYTYLHRDIPIIPLANLDQVAKEASAVDFIVSRENLWSATKEFEEKGCWNGVCLYSRNGSCIRLTSSELNNSLKDSGS